MRLKNVLHVSGPKSFSECAIIGRAPIIRPVGPISQPVNSPRIAVLIGGEALYSHTLSLLDATPCDKLLNVDEETMANVKAPFDLYVYANKRGCRNVPPSWPRFPSI